MSRAMPRPPRWLKIAFRAGCSIGLIVTLWLSVDPRQVATTLARIDIFYLLLALLAQWVGMGLSVAKWRRFLALEGIAARTSYLFQVYLIGSFWNNFLPSSVGGDVVRSLYTARAFGSRAGAVRSIVFERLTGLLSIIVLCAMAVPFLIVQHPRTLQLFDHPLFVMAMVGVVVVVAVFGQTCWRGFPRLRERAIRLLTPPPPLRRPAPWLVSMLLSLLFQANVALILWLVGRSLQIEVGWWPVWLCAPVLSLISMVPVTINGFGVREAGFVALFSLYGVATADALVWSVVVYATVAIAGLPGGVLYSVYPANRAIRQHLQAAPDTTSSQALL